LQSRYRAGAKTVLRDRLELPRPHHLSGAVSRKSIADCGPVGVGLLTPMGWERRFRK